MRTREPQRSRWLAAAIVAASAAIASVAGLIAGLALRGGGSAPALTVEPAARRPPSLPPKDALVLARQDRELAVALAARPAGGGVELTATVVGQRGYGMTGLEVRFTVVWAGRRESLRGRPCGSGCYRARATEPAPDRVVVHLSRAGRRSSAVPFELPARWPPAPAARIVARADRVFRGLRTVVVDEQLASRPGNAVATTFELAAPNRLAYRTSRGAAAIVIGARRWDRGPDGEWQRSEQQALPQPRPPWQQVSNAHLLGSSTRAGRPVWLVSFLDPRVPAWFTAWIDRRSHRTLELRMIAAAHFMHERYSAFNSPLEIKPP